MEKKADENISERKEKIKGWFEDKGNLILVAVLILAFAIRLYYFFQTYEQTLWWDEAEYMSYAKHWAFGINYELNPQRLPLFQLLATIPFLVGFGETFVRFFLVLLPSTFLVFAIYLLGKEMFNKKVGLIAAFLASISWVFIFWTARINPDFFSLSFQVLSILFMWKYWKQGKSLFVVLSGIFAATGFLFKISGLLVPLVFFVFILIKDRFSALKNKNYYFFAIAFFGTLIPYFIWSQIAFGTPLAFRATYLEAVTSSFPLAWYNLNFYYFLTENVFFILFIIGLFLALKFLLYFDILIKDKSKLLDPNIFGILVFALVSAFYIFYIKATEDRHVFLWLPFIFFFIGNALIFIYEQIKKYSKIFAFIIVLGLVLFGVYSQLNHADELIKIKKGSYMPVKEAALWMKENSNPSDVILTMSYSQTAYYSERAVYSYSNRSNMEELDELVAMKNPKFFEVSIFERYPTFLNEWLEKNKEKLNPVRAYFADAENKQPVLIVYAMP